MKPYEIALAASAALMASTALSNANTIVQSESIVSLTNWGNSSNLNTFSPTAAITLAGFDASLGTLTGIVITIADTVSGDIDISNSGAGSTGVTGFLENQAKFIIPTIAGTHLLQVDSNEVSTTLGSGDRTRKHTCC